VKNLTSLSTLPVETEQIMATFSDLRISTMTVFGHLGASPNLDTMLKEGHFIPYGSFDEGIIKMQFNQVTRGTCSSDLLHSSTKAKKHFLNQASLVFRFKIPDDPIAVKEINIKLFKNGGFQMTGINCEKMARAALERLIEQNKDKAIWESAPFIKTFKICLINSDFSINKLVIREALHRIFIEEFGLRSFFEPTIYQGVNTKFFWNKESPESAPPGICGCPEQCLGNGDGLSIGSCKCITIAPFRTGKVIINGAQNLQQINDVYKFMVNLLTRFESEVLRDPDVSSDVVVPGKLFKTTVEFLKKKSRASPKQMFSLPASIAPKNIPA
jgi:TATA-box binding protein (TBP) (component of TFIID and TFIIIB)